MKKFPFQSQRVTFTQRSNIYDIQKFNTMLICYKEAPIKGVWWYTVLINIICVIFIEYLLLGKIEISLETYYTNVIEVTRFMQSTCLFLWSLRERNPYYYVRMPWGAWPFLILLCLYMNCSFSLGNFSWRYMKFFVEAFNNLKESL